MPRRRRSRKQADPTELLFVFGLLLVVLGGSAVSALPRELLLLGSLGVVIVGALIFTGFYFVIYLKEKAQREALLQLTIDDVDNMTGIEFENYVEALLKKRGYRVTQTAVSGDFGVDLIAGRNKRVIAVQCKRYRKPIGLSAIQEAHAGMDYYHCNASLVITNNTFTAAAVKLARQTQCQLIGRAELAAIAAGARDLF